MYNPIRTRTSWTRCRVPSRLPKTLHFPKSVKFHQIFCNVRNNHLNIWISCSPSPFQTCSLLSPASWSVLRLVKIRLLTPIPNLACSLHIWPTFVGGLEEVFQDTTPRLPSVSWGYHISSTWVMSHPHFHLKVKGHTRKNIFIHAQRLPLELVFLMKFVKIQSPSQCKF